jgi:hypothetical protein
MGADLELTSCCSTSAQVLAEEVGPLASRLIDCHDAETLAAFWRSALGDPETEQWRDGHSVGYLELRAEGETLLFQPVVGGQGGQEPPGCFRSRRSLDRF